MEAAVEDALSAQSDLSVLVNREALLLRSKKPFEGERGFSDLFFDVGKISPQDHGLAAKHLSLLGEILSDINYPSKPDYLPLKVDVYRFDLVTSPAELLKSFQLRFLSYSHPNVQNIDPAKFPLGLEFDRYDKAALHVFVINIETGEWCGNARMILDNPMGLQVEMNMDINDYRMAGYRVCEMSRMVSYPQGQKKMNRALLELFRHIANERMIDKMVGESRESQKEYFTSIGFVPMEPYRTWRLEAKESWSSTRVEKVYGNIMHVNPLQLGVR